MKNFVFFFFFIIYQTSLLSQEQKFYIIGSEIFSLDFEQNCIKTRDFPSLDPTNIAERPIIDIAFNPNEKFYALSPDHLYEVDLQTGILTPISPIPDFMATGLLSDSKGNLYIAGRKFHIFNTITNTFNTIGSLPSPCGGDLIWNEGDLYYTNNENQLIKINQDIPENSEVYIDFPNDINPFGDIANLTYSCDSTKAILLPSINSENPAKSVYYLDFTDNSIHFLCDNVRGSLQGGTSPLDFLQSQCALTIDLDLNNSSNLIAQNYQLDTFCVTSIPITDNDLEVFANAPIDSIHIKISSSPQAAEEEQLTITNSFGISLQPSDNQEIILIGSPATTFEDYENAIKNIRYEITGNIIAGGERQIELTAYSDGRTSDLATAFLNINTTDAPSAGIDTQTEFCNSNRKYQLLDMLDGTPFPNGRWLPKTVLGNNLFSIQKDTVRTFQYITGGALGCASDTSVLDISILPIPQTGFPVNAAVPLFYCTGSPFPITTTHFDTAFVESFIWEDGLLDLNRTITEETFGNSPFFSINFTASNGCENSVTYINAEVDTFQVWNFIYGCDSDEVIFNDESFTTDTTITNRILGGENCDTVYITTISFLSQVEQDINTTICSEQTYTIGNQTFSENGNYQITLPNFNGCDTLINLNLTVINTPTLTTIEVSPADCSDSTRTLSAVGDWETIHWSTGETTATIEVNETAIYAVTVTNGNQCSTSDSVFVEIASAENIMVQSQITDNSCPDGNEGLIVLNVSGTAPFDINWSDGETGNFRGALTAGIYIATITDGNGCTAIFQDSVSAPPAFAVEGEITNATNANTNNGAIKITSVTGGTPPYDLSWSNGMMGDELINLDVGNYTLTVLDALGCQFRIGYAVSVNTAVEEPVITDTELWIQPNPSRNGSGQVISNKYAIEQVKLYSIDGKQLQVFAPKQQQIFATTAGIYLVEIELKNGWQIWRKWLVY